MRHIFLALPVLITLTSASAASTATVSFEVDARVELLSVALMLSDRADFKARRPEGLDAYAAAAAAHFAPFSGHPAVARVAELRKHGAAASELTRAALEGGGELSKDLEEFSRAARFDEFFKSQEAARLSYTETARHESKRALSPEAALAYMGLPFTGEHRFILAPLLPDDGGAGEIGVRPGAPARGPIGFRFDLFEGSVAAELCRAAANWVPAPSGDMPDYIAAAVGLRVLAADLGEPAYHAALRLAAERLPRLEAVSERLKDYESGRARYPTLEKFFPRIEAFAAIRLEQASAAAARGERAAALTFLAAARKQNPNLETRRHIVPLYHDLGEAVLAKSLSDELFREFPGDPGVLLDRATLAGKVGDRKTALAVLAKLDELNPDENARRRMAALYMELKEYAPARILIEALSAAAPGDLNLSIDRAIVAARTGDRDAARSLLAAVAKQKPADAAQQRMAALYSELEAPAPAKARLVVPGTEGPVDRAAVAVKAGDRETALRLLDAARKLSPDIDTRYRMLQLYRDLNADRQVRELTDELLRSAAQDARLRLDAAGLAARGGDRPAAREHLAAARLLKPSLDESRLIADLYRGLGDDKQAKIILAELIAQAPGDPRLRIDHAALAARTGDRDAALRALAEAGALKPAPEERRRMALLYQDLKDNANALTIFTALARETPADAALLGDLGLSKYLNGQEAAAIEDLRAAIKLDSSSLQAIITLGSIYGAGKRFDLELAVYDAAPPAGGEPELRTALLRSRTEALARGRPNQVH